VEFQVDSSCEWIVRGLIRSTRIQLIRLILSQVEAIERLTREVEALRADNGELRAKLNLPPKTPKNFSTPPS
jgi:transposase